MAVVEMVVTKVAMRSDNGYLAGGIVSRGAVTLALARYEVSRLVLDLTCTVERITPTQLKLAVCQDDEWVWYFFGPTKHQPEGFLREFVPIALHLIRCDARGPAMCTPQAQIMAFPGARSTAAVPA